MSAGRPGSCGWGGARTRPVFFAEIGSVPRRDRSGGVTPGCRGHETGISARDRHLRASPTGPSSDSRRNVEFDVPRRCASGAVPPRTRDRARSWPRRRRRTRTGMLMSAGLPAADPEGGGGHARNARVGQTTSAGGTTPPPTGSSPGARAASLCSTAPGLRNTFSLIVNIPDRRRPARRQRSRDEGPRVGTDLDAEYDRSRRRDGSGRRRSGNAGRRPWSAPVGCGRTRRPTACASPLPKKFACTVTLGG